MLFMDTPLVVLAACSTKRNNYFDPKKFAFDVKEFTAPEQKVLIMFYNEARRVSEDKMSFFIFTDSVNLGRQKPYFSHLNYLL